MTVLGVIPARLKSTRLFEKMLLPVKGKPLVAHAYGNALRSRLDGAVIAVDHERMKRELEKHGCRVCLTSRRHRSGTDRVGEVAQRIKADFYMNIQGDEPLVHPGMLNLIADHARKNPASAIVTAGKIITDPEEIRDPNVVKIVMNAKGEALYFSRSPVPYDRDGRSRVRYVKHFGIYCFRRDVLKRIVRLKPSPLEKAEKLEQLRFLENGYRIRVVLTGHDTISVDTRKDYIKVKAVLEKRPLLRKRR